jgi:hypothetical protein
VEQVIQRVEAWLELNPDADVSNVSALARTIAKAEGLNVHSVRRVLTQGLRDKIQGLYSNRLTGSGKGLTKREIAEHLGSTVADVSAVIQGLGITHYSGPIGPGVGEWLTDLQKEAELIKFEAQVDKEIRDKAAKFDALKAGWNPIVDWLEKNFGLAKGPVPDVVLQPGSAQRALVLHPSDLHIGKKGSKGESSNLVIDALHGAVEAICERAMVLGVDRIITTVGNDWFHVDNITGATSRGTPQHIDRHVFNLVGAGYDLAFQYIEWLRGLGFPIDVVVVPSNHDAMAMIGLGHALRIAYQNTPQVQVHHTDDARAYIKYGRNLLGFTHGHTANPANLPRYMADEAFRLWAECPFRYWITGHLHHAKHKQDLEVDSHGVHILQGPSISLTDKWHEDNGWTLAQKALAGYTFHAEYGHEDRMLANVRYEK